MWKLVAGGFVVMALSVSSAFGSSHVSSSCSTAAAPRLCTIHQFHRQANHTRARIGLSPLPYHWVAERRPALRDRLVRYWYSVRNRQLARLVLWRQTSTCMGAVHFWFPASAWAAARAVVSRETGGTFDPRSHNPSGASGCFQLMPEWWNGSSRYGWRFDPYDANLNVEHAWLLWRAAGGSFCPGQWCL